MYTNVLVGIDQEDGGRDALALAQELLSADGVLTLGHVHNGYPIVGRGASPVFEAAERDRSMGVLETARDDAGIVAQLRPIASPYVGRGLHVLAEAIEADLIVVGSTRRGRIGRVLLGDDTTGALDGASCAVAVAPAGYTQHPKAMREIGVAYNESPESEHALGLARGIAGELDARLSVFEAVELPRYAYASGMIPAELAPEQLLEETRQRLAELPDVEPHVVFGIPAEELALYSASVNLLVLGSREYGPMGRLIHGSTTRQLLRSARCPLLVLTKAARASDAVDELPVGAATACGAATA